MTDDMELHLFSNMPSSQKILVARDPELREKAG